MPKYAPVLAVVAITAVLGGAALYQGMDGSFSARMFGGNVPCSALKDKTPEAVRTCAARVRADCQKKYEGDARAIGQCISKGMRGDAQSQMSRPMRSAAPTSRPARR